MMQLLACLWLRRAAAVVQLIEMMSGSGGKQHLCWTFHNCALLHFLRKCNAAVTSRL